MNDYLEKEIIRLVNNYETPRRISFSGKYPAFKKQIVFLHCLFKSIQYFFDPRIKLKRSNNFFNYILASHQAVLRRAYGNSDLVLQENKIINLKKAIEKINGVVVGPGKVFSFWNTIGSPADKNGYVSGRFFINGKVEEETGGGLCQLSTFLFWMFLHIPAKILERHNHSIDDFPGSGNNLPFRCGAAVLYNSVDLKIRNDHKYPIQLKLWVTENDLNGQIVSLGEMPGKINIVEDNHCFIKTGDKIYQYSEIYREIINNSGLIKKERTATNFTQVLYKVTDGFIKENNFEYYDFSSMPDC